eukprot:6192800-Pleurochrysis_carterae.AAC.3
MLTHLSPRFSERFCGHNPGTHNSIVGKAADGAAYRTRAAQHYPTELNAALAASILKLLPATAAVLRDAGGDAETDTAKDDLDVLLNMGDADVIAAYGLKAHGDDIPTWAKAMKSDEANQWKNAAREEMQNFERHGVYIEISEDQLPSWNQHSKRAAEDIDVM